MLHLERLDAGHDGPADSFADRVVFQTRPWLSFVASSQRAEPVVAAVRDGPATVGYFTGLLVRRYGFRVLGSPLPGWTTQYLGFNLVDGVPRRAALEALLPFAFGTLRCSHLELRDRRLDVPDLDGLGLAYTPSVAHTVDLRRDEDALLARMSSSCRRNIRKAGRLGVTVEPSTDPGFAGEYYDQLIDVFAKQGLVPTYGIERVRALLDRLGPSGRLLLLRSRDPRGRCVATGVFPWFNRTMYFWGGASYRQYHHLRPNEVLMWHAMRYAKSRGLTEFDLGGGAGSYKSKYGTVETVIPWARRSRSPVVAQLRNTLKGGVAVRQKVAGRIAPLRAAFRQDRAAG